MSRRRLAIVLSIAIVATGCDQGNDAPRASAGQPTSSLAPAAPPTPSVAPVEPTIEWTSPTKNARIAAYEVDVAVHAIAPDLRRIEFAVSWNGGSAEACTAVGPDKAGVWSCHANLLRAGVPPGPVTFTVKAFDTGERVVAALKQSLQATFAVAPPRPGSVKVEFVSAVEDVDEPGLIIEVQRIRWTAPEGYATEFRLYGVTACPNYGPGNDGEPCLLPGTPLEKNQMRLIETVDGSERSMTVSNGIPDGLCGGGLWCSPYYALVLGAFNAYGNSVYAIPASADVCYECTY